MDGPLGPVKSKCDGITKSRFILCVDLRPADTAAAEVKSGSFFTSWFVVRAAWRDSLCVCVVCVQIFAKYVVAMCQNSATKTSEIKELSELRETLGLDGLLMGEALYQV